MHTTSPAVHTPLVPHATAPALDPTLAAPAVASADAGELSDDELEHVVGGLARVWSERTIARLIRS